MVNVKKSSDKEKIGEEILQEIKNLGIDLSSCPEGNRKKDNISLIHDLFFDPIFLSFLEHRIYNFKNINLKDGNYHKELEILFDHDQNIQTEGSIPLYRALEIMGITEELEDGEYNFSPMAYFYDKRFFDTKLGLWKVFLVQREFEREEKENQEELTQEEEEDLKEKISNFYNFSTYEDFFSITSLRRNVKKAQKEEIDLYKSLINRNKKEEAITLLNFNIKRFNLKRDVEDYLLTLRNYFRDGSIKEVISDKNLTKLLEQKKFSQTIKNISEKKLKEIFLLLLEWKSGKKIASFNQSLLNELFEKGLSPFATLYVFDNQDKYDKMVGKNNPILSLFDLKERFLDYKILSTRINSENFFVQPIEKETERIERVSHLISPFQKAEGYERRGKFNNDFLNLISVDGNKIDFGDDVYSTYLEVKEGCFDKDDAISSFFAHFRYKTFNFFWGEPFFLSTLFRKMEFLSYNDSTKEIFSSGLDEIFNNFVYSTILTIENRNDKEDFLLPFIKSLRRTESGINEGFFPITTYDNDDYEIRNELKDDGEQLKRYKEKKKKDVEEEWKNVRSSKNFNSDLQGSIERIKKTRLPFSFLNNFNYSEKDGKRNLFRFSLICLNDWRSIEELFMWEEELNIRSKRGLHIVFNLKNPENLEEKKILARAGFLDESLLLPLKSQDLVNNLISSSLRPYFKIISNDIRINFPKKEDEGYVETLIDKWRDLNKVFFSDHGQEYKFLFKEKPLLVLGLSTVGNFLNYKIENFVLLEQKIINNELDIENIKPLASSCYENIATINYFWVWYRLREIGFKPVIIPLERINATHERLGKTKKEEIIQVFLGEKNDSERIKKISEIIFAITATRDLFPEEQTCGPFMSEIVLNHELGKQSTHNLDLRSYCGNDGRLCFTSWWFQEKRSDKYINSTFPFHDDGVDELIFNVKELLKEDILTKEQIESIKKNEKEINEIFTKNATKTFLKDDLELVDGREITYQNKNLKERLVHLKEIILKKIELYNNNNKTNITNMTLVNPKDKDKDKDKTNPSEAEVEKKQQDDLVPDPDATAKDKTPPVEEPEGRTLRGSTRKQTEESAKKRAIADASRKLKKQKSQTSTAKSPNSSPSRSNSNKSRSSSKTGRIGVIDEDDREKNKDDDEGDTTDKTIDKTIGLDDSLKTGSDATIGDSGKIPNPLQSRFRSTPHHSSKGPRINIDFNAKDSPEMTSMKPPEMTADVPIPIFGKTVAGRTQSHPIDPKFQVLTPPITKKTMIPPTIPSTTIGPTVIVTTTPPTTTSPTTSPVVATAPSTTTLPTTTGSDSEPAVTTSIATTGTTTLTTASISTPIMTSGIAVSEADIEKDERKKMSQMKLFFEDSLSEKRRADPESPKTTEDKNIEVINSFFLRPDMKAWEKTELPDELIKEIGNCFYFTNGKNSENKKIVIFSVSNFSYVKEMDPNDRDKACYFNSLFLKIKIEAGNKQFEIDNCFLATGATYDANTLSDEKANLKSYLIIPNSNLIQNNNSFKSNELLPSFVENGNFLAIPYEDNDNFKISFPIGNDIKVHHRGVTVRIGTTTETVRLTHYIEKEPFFGTLNKKGFFEKNWGLFSTLGIMAACFITSAIALIAFPDFFVNLIKKVEEKEEEIFEEEKK